MDATAKHYLTLGAIIAAELATVAVQSFAQERALLLERY